MNVIVNIDSHALLDATLIMEKRLEELTSYLRKYAFQLSALDNNSSMVNAFHINRYLELTKTCKSLNEALNLS